MKLQVCPVRTPIKAPTSPNWLLFPEKPVERPAGTTMGYSTRSGNSPSIYVH